MAERYNLVRDAWGAVTAEDEAVLREPGRELYTKLCERARLNDTLVLGLGTARAHTKFYTLQQWLALWGKHHEE